MLMIANGEEVKIGVPFVDGGVIKAEVVAHGRGEKVKIVKFRRRKHYRKQQGHRQWFTDENYWHQRLRPEERFQMAHKKGWRLHT